MAYIYIDSQEKHHTCPVRGFEPLDAEPRMEPRSRDLRSDHVEAFIRVKISLVN